MLKRLPHTARMLPRINPQINKQFLFENPIYGQYQSVPVRFLTLMADVVGRCRFVSIFLTTESANVIFISLLVVDSW